MRALLDLIFPRACLACGAHADAWLCSPCADAFPWILHPCVRCGAPSASDASDCARCRGKTFAYERARSAAVYAGPARATLLGFKLGGERRAASALAQSMVASLDGEYDVVTFVPSTRRTRARRGFDPAELLGRGVARELRLPCRATLRKIRETADQAGLGREARARNLRGAFVALPEAGRILLVDDIITTGATVAECTRALRLAGIGQIGILTFARAL